MKLLCMFLTLMGTHGFSQSPPETLSKYKTSILTQSAMDKVAAEFEVTARRGQNFEVIVPAARAKDFLAIDPQATLLEADIHEPLRALRLQWAGGYHTFKTVKETLDTLVTTYPSLVKLEVYGQSEEGRNLYALKVSDNVASQEAEPEIMITSATHGDEPMSVEVLLGLLDRLLKGYGNDPRLTRYVNEMQIYFLPVINPDGYVRDARYANGVDPNRDYPLPGGPAKRSNACISNVIDFFKSHFFVGSMDFHTHGEMIMYPWAYTSNPVQAIWENIFETLTGKMAQTNGYVHGQISQVIYEAPGSSADYYFHTQGTIALGIEIASSSYLPASTIPAHVDDMEQATWTFLDHFLVD